MAEPKPCYVCKKANASYINVPGSRQMCMGCLKKYCKRLLQLSRPAWQRFYDIPSGAWHVYRYETEDLTDEERAQGAKTAWRTRRADVADVIEGAAYLVHEWLGDELDEETLEELFPSKYMRPRFFDRIRELLYEDN